MERHELEWLIWTQIKTYRLQQQKMVMMCSGGADSMALLHAVHFFCPLIVVHIHHGEFENAKYRNEALHVVQEFCQKLKLELVVLQNKDTTLRSEKQLREFRYQQARKVMSEYKAQGIILAHHQQDLLETRLIRLIRGTGQQGLKAMQVWNSQLNLWRPWLHTPQSSILSYVKTQKIPWRDDPTNRKTSYLRNWLRHEWLPLLEKKYPGALASIGRSLDSMAQETDLEVLVAEDEGILRSWFLTLSQKQQLQCLAKHLYQLKKMDFTHSQLKEIQKRLDNPQKEYTFVVGGCFWRVSAQHIIAKVQKTSLF